MAGKHLVHFEPVGIDIEVDEDQTILRAAFEQGVMLPHGCKEGQCASCKAFLLEGDEVDHDSYSTFAMADFERDDGYTLLCRAHAYEDLTIELFNYDEEMITAGLPITDAVVEVVSNDHVTHDMRHLVVRLLEPSTIKFFPGQYVDFAVPGTEEARSFSMANTSSQESGLLEFIIKIYPDGLFSQFLDTKVSVGDHLDINGPYGMFTLRDNPRGELLFLGGGAGIGPILCLLRTMAERGIERRAAFYYGVRTERDLCLGDELGKMVATLPDFRYVSALSEPADDSWTGETGFITDVLSNHVTDLAGTDVYVCGPPPMVDAALELLPTLGADEARIFYDKFTTTGELGSD